MMDGDEMSKLRQAGRAEAPGTYVVFGTSAVFVAGWLGLLLYGLYEIAFAMLG
jgi:hypothetical protein